MNGYVIGLKHFPLDIYAAAGNIPMWNENFFHTFSNSGNGFSSKFEKFNEH